MLTREQVAEGRDLEDIACSAFANDADRAARTAWLVKHVDALLDAAERVARDAGRVARDAQAEDVASRSGPPSCSLSAAHDCLRPGVTCPACEFTAPQTISPDQEAEAIRAAGRRIADDIRAQARAAISAAHPVCPTCKRNDGFGHEAWCPHG